MLQRECRDYSAVCAIRSIPIGVELARNLNAAILKDPEIYVPRQPIILIVEDDEPLRAMWRTALRLEGFDVIEAGDGLEALKLIESTQPDLVVLDIGLPHVDGVSVRQDLAAQVFSRRIPVVVITGSADDLSYLDVDCVIRKPVTVDQVVLVVQRCLRVAAPTIAI